MLPIKDYAVIGDCRSAALVSRAGSIDWLCWPRFDSPSLFGALLDDRAGQWRIAPVLPASTRRRYLQRTNVLETTFDSDAGTLVLTDLMPVASEQEKRELLVADHEILRIARCTRGELDVDMVLEPRPRYGRERPQFRDAGQLGLRLATAEGLLVLRADAPVTVSDGRAELHGNITDNDPLTANITVLGKDVYTYPRESSSDPNLFDSTSYTYTVTFFQNTEVIVLFALPITIKGAIAGDIGVTATVQTGNDTLSLQATPAIGATATCSAALGGGKGSFSLTAGVEGSLNLFQASLETSARVSPFTNHVTYAIGSEFTISALDGWIRAFLKAKLKPLFKKTFKQTLATWGGVSETIPLFSYKGCMSY